MNNSNLLLPTLGWLLPLIFILGIWDMVWKIIGMWKAGRNNELVWFICIAVFNTLGILPIIYILINKNKDANQQSSED